MDAAATDEKTALLPIMKIPPLRHLFRLKRRPVRPGETITFGIRRIYILPTGQGMLFSLFLLLLLIGSINYQINLGYMLTFLLASLGMVAMIHTWRNLLGLSVQGGRVEPVFNGQEACFPLHISERNRRNRYAVRFSLADGAVVVRDLPAGEGQRIPIHAPTERRGAFDPGPITLSSVYPLGLFRAWCYADTGMSCLVYPTPAPSGQPPTESLEGGESGGSSGKGSDDFVGLIPYREGDSLRHIHWKALARERGLVTKQFGGDQAQRISLDWALLPGMDTEIRLSLLCRFVLLADEQQQHYHLKLPGLHLPEGNGERHKHDCLAALARF